MLNRSSVTLVLAATLLAIISIFVTGMDSPLADRRNQQASEAAPLTDADLSEIQRSLTGSALIQQAVSKTDAATGQASETARCHGLAGALQRARLARAAGEIRRARRQARPLTEVSDREESRCLADDNARLPDRARLFLAHLELDEGRPEAALGYLEGLSRSTPVDDYVAWLKGKAYEALDQPGKAADVYGALHQMSASPLYYRARAQQALTLLEARRYAEALPIVDRLLELFPDYPRRFRLLYGRARALEATGDLQEAAEAYRSAWLAYPHKETGDLSLAALESLAARGVSIPPIDRERLFDRYRQLRIHRHWDLSRRLFERLLARESTPGGHSKFEHRVQLQLALCDFYPKHNRDALLRLEDLRSEWERGYRKGIQIRIVDRYLSRTHARLGNAEAALAALRRSLRGSSELRRKSEIAEFLRDHGRHEEAFQIIDEYYSSWRKRRWDYAWLLYETGRMERALERFAWMAEHRHDERRPRALYWSARTVERMGRIEEAARRYRDLRREYPLHYYGIQAENRLLDLKQRQTLEGDFRAQADRILRSSEPVLYELERAAEAIEGQPTRQRLSAPAPKRPDDGADASGPVANDCELGPGRAEEACLSASGQTSRAILDAFEQALSPLSPLSGLADAPVSVRRPGPEMSPEPSKDDDAPSGEIPAIDFPTQARIYWNGRYDSQVAFARYADGRTFGPQPDAPTAYPGREHLGGIAEAAQAHGDLFPGLIRARWLNDAGLEEAARRETRRVALEFRALVEAGVPPLDDPHPLEHRRWVYLVDYRRDGRGWWGYQGEPQLQYPVPTSKEGRRRAAARQREIVAEQQQIRPRLIDALKEAGNYYLVRKFTFEAGDWYNRSPVGPAREMWTQAYPRAYPQLVLREARRRGINPYLIWALMTVESAYNADSVSHAHAIGLLQVIPRTGIKVADWLGDEDFGPHDLIDPDTAITHGVRYFSSLVEKFRGQELFAIAGYNGGPHRVATWLDKRGDMPMDEFVEEIPFTQARNYVRKVTKYLTLYLRLYEGRQRLYIGQNVDLSYRPYPNF